MSRVKIQIPKTLEEIGIKVENLDEQDRAMLENGEKSRLFNDLKIKLPSGKEVPFAGKIHLWKDQDGNVQYYVHSVRAEPILSKYQGYEFNQEEQKQLREQGQVDHPVVLSFKGKEHTCMIGIDPETREVMHVPCQNIYIPPTILGRKISDDERMAIQKGGKVYLENLQKEGKTFDAIVSFSFSKNPGKGGLSFKTPSPTELQTIRKGSLVETNEQRQASKEKKEVKQEPVTLVQNKKRQGPKL